MFEFTNNYTVQSDPAKRYKSYKYYDKKGDLNLYEVTLLAYENDRVELTIILRDLNSSASYNFVSKDFSYHSIISKSFRLDYKSGITQKYAVYFQVDPIKTEFEQFIRFIDGLHRFSVQTKRKFLSYEEREQIAEIIFQHSKVKQSFAAATAAYCNDKSDENFLQAFSKLQHEPDLIKDFCLLKFTEDCKVSLNFKHAFLACSEVLDKSFYYRRAQYELGRLMSSYQDLNEDRFEAMCEAITYFVNAKGYKDAKNQIEKTYEELYSLIDELIALRKQLYKDLQNENSKLVKAPQTFFFIEETAQGDEQSEQDYSVHTLHK